MYDKMKSLIDGASKIGINLDRNKIKKFDEYMSLLIKWNKKMNLVRLQNEIDLVQFHFLDSLWCSAGYDFCGSHKVLDLGSGAGFPGIPLKIAFPDLHVFLLESQRKRCDFLNEVIGLLGLHNCNVIYGRAELYAHDLSLREEFDCVVSRALAKLVVLSELAIPFIKVGGFLVALKGRDVVKEIKDAEYALDLLGGMVFDSIPYSFPGENGRNVLVIKKIKETPETYPRRAGIPEKRPILKEKDKK